jgi:hypothetical protein
MSHSSRRKHLWDQHRFDIGVDHLKGKRMRMELVGANHALPPSSPIHGGGDEESLTRRIENATEEFEHFLHEITAEVTSSSSAGGGDGTAKALEQSTLELYNRSVEELQNERHILLIPILSVHVDACALVLQDPSLSNAVRLGVLCRQTVSSLRLLPLQEMLLGPDHFDLARTNLDLANCVSELLSKSPKQLYALNMPSMSTFSDWSGLEHKARRKHERIKSLYPHDADEYLRNQQHKSLP